MVADSKIKTLPELDVYIKLNIIGSAPCLFRIIFSCVRKKGSARKGETESSMKINGNLRPPN